MIKFVFARTRGLQHNTVRRVRWAHAAGKKLGAEHIQMLQDLHLLRLGEKVIDAGSPVATSNETHFNRVSNEKRREFSTRVFDAIDANLKKIEVRVKGRRGSRVGVDATD
jgi:hypothetical protein